MRSKTPTRDVLDKLEKLSADVADIKNMLSRLLGENKTHPTPISSFRARANIALAERARLDGLKKERGKNKKR